MGVHVSAQNLGLKASRGWVYRDVTLHVDAGALAAITGPASSGRTSLLLTLAGRMKPSAGQAQVGEHALPRHLHAVQRMVGLGVFHGVNDLDETLRVSDLVREQLSLRRRARHVAGVRGVLDRVGLDLDPHLLARDLHPDQRVLLGAALGLVGDPQVLLVDDLDVGCVADAQRGVWAALRGVADSGVTVLASCLDPAPGRDAQLLDTVVSIVDPAALAVVAAPVSIELGPTELGSTTVPADVEV